MFISNLYLQVFLTKDPVNFKEDVADPGWCAAMDVELYALEENAIASVKGWFTCQMDVSNAFLHGDLFEEVYMKPPLGYIGKGHNVSADSKLDSQLVPVLLLFLSMYDLLITGNDESQINSLKAQLGSVFHMKDLGELNYFLGLEVFKSSHGIFISQHKYILKNFLKKGELCTISLTNFLWNLISSYKLMLVLHYKTLKCIKDLLGN
ncbi:cysteine-rich receptor-like protein kinase 8 [Tanacetum coccineum]